MDVATVVSAVVAVASAVVSGFFALRAYRLQEQAMERDALERLRDWAEDTVAVLVAMHDLAEGAVSDDSREPQRQTLLTGLSSQIEKGRWFFPNTQDPIGDAKPSAYRGYRHPVLDKLVDAHRGLEEIDGHPRQEVAERLKVCRRKFVSDIQVEIDPNRSQDQNYADLQRRYAQRAQGRSRQMSR